jgi:hypothetical protein
MLAAILLLIALISPLPGFDWFTPDTSAVFEFGVIGKVIVTHQYIIHNIKRMTYPLSNGSWRVSTIDVTRTITVTKTWGPGLGNGLVTLRGKGGLSAGNPLEMQVTLYFPSEFSNSSSIIRYVPEGAFEAQESIIPFQTIWETDALGFPIPANITLTIQNSCVRISYPRECLIQNTDRSLTKWAGHEKIVYNQGGNMSAQVTLGAQVFHASPGILIGGSEVTVAARTNSLLIGLTIALIGFGVLETRHEERGKYCEYSENDNTDYHNYN